MGKCALCLAVLLPQPIKHLIQEGLQEQAKRDAAVCEVLGVRIPEKQLFSKGDPEPLHGKLKNSRAVWVDPVRVN